MTDKDEGLQATAWLFGALNTLVGHDHGGRHYAQLRHVYQVDRYGHDAPEAVVQVTGYRSTSNWNECIVACRQHQHMV